MDKQKVAEFFDRLAPTWDEGAEHSNAVLTRILDNAEVSAGECVLDIGCGTGVMVPYYLERNVKEVVGIDLSPEMLNAARRKFPMSCVRFMNADAETCRFEPDYDICVVYNAFPHFPDPVALVQNLASALRPGGRFTIAHGASRETIDRGHMGSAHDVSLCLPSDDALKALLAPYFDVTAYVSDNTMLQIVGVKR